MIEIMNRALVVGGNFGDIPKKSMVADQISFSLNSEFGYNDNIKTVNGGTIEDLPFLIDQYDLTIWMPSIGNHIEKKYPVKKLGSVLICSKVVREDTAYIDSVARIFKMHGNAVIEIRCQDKFHFTLIDALMNIWYRGTDLFALSKKIKEFYDWTKSSERVETVKIPNRGCDDFLEINSKFIDKYNLQIGDRFFGNVSTRCRAFFPSSRLHYGILVSARNSDKRILSKEDMVLCFYNVEGKIEYFGDKKPSVDTPIQMKIYDETDFNYIIHGHAYIKSAKTTKNYFPCGDLREANEIISLIKNKSIGSFINIKNHGFIIFSRTVLWLRLLLETIEFTNVERDVNFILDKPMKV